MNSMYDEARVEDNSSVDFDFPYKNLGLKSKLYSLIFSFLGNLGQKLKILNIYLHPL